MVGEQRLLQLITPESGFDTYTIEHQKEVANISNAIAIEMGLSDKQILCITLGAAFHDTGKLFLPKRLLGEKGGLGDAEIGLIRQHCFDGMALLKSIGIAPCIYQIAFQHHERLDGSGYPGGLSGSQISLESRIVAVADVFDAMVRDRLYRPALSVDMALNEININKGTLYDPEVVDILYSIPNIKEGKGISCERLENCRTTIRTRKWF
ncbi:MAG: HD domain-containing phosphohydrolase [Syntrophales bacterium]|nr:HD domain-containing phosphohydrolase [Syntrophales bacterium]